MLVLPLFFVVGQASYISIVIQLCAALVLVQVEDCPCFGTLRCESDPLAQPVLQSHPRDPQRFPSPPLFNSFLNQVIWQTVEGNCMITIRVVLIS